MPTPRRQLALAAAVLGPIIGMGGFAHAQVTILPGVVDTGIEAISDNGVRVAGGRSGSGYYFWDADSGFINVDRPGSGQAPLPLLSGDGTTILGLSRQTGSVGHAFLATASGGFTVLPYLAQQGVAGSVPYGISRDGSVVAGWDADSHGQSLGSWRWTDAGMQALSLRFVTGMSGDGNTILGAFFDNARGVVWRSGEITQLSPLPGSEIQNIQLLATNYDGSIICGLSGFRAAVWINGQGTFLPTYPGFTNFSATDLSEDGTVIVGRMAADNASTFVWTQATGTVEIGEYLRSFGYDLSPYAISEAHVSADGRTFGMTGRSSIDGSVRGIIVTIPTPATPAAFAALLTLCPRRRRPQAQRPALLLPVVL